MNIRKELIIVMLICLKWTHSQNNDFNSKNSSNNNLPEIKQQIGTSDFGFPEGDVHFELNDNQKNGNVSLILNIKYLVNIL